LSDTLVTTFAGPVVRFPDSKAHCIQFGLLDGDFNALHRPAAETLQWEDQCCGSRLRPLKANPEILPTTEAPDILPAVHCLQKWQK
jgi:hypothetical protein